MIDLDDVMTADQAASYVGVSRQRIYALTKTGKLVPRRVGSTHLYLRDDLDAWKAAPKHPGGRPRKGPAASCAGKATPITPQTNTPEKEGTS